MSFRIRQCCRQFQSYNRDGGGCNRDRRGESKEHGAGGGAGVGGVGGLVTVHLKYLSAEDLSVDDALAVYKCSVLFSSVNFFGVWMTLLRCTNFQIAIVLFYLCWCTKTMYVSLVHSTEV